MYYFNRLKSQQESDRWPNRWNDMSLPTLDIAFNQLHVVILVVIIVVISFALYSSEKQNELA